MSLWKSRRTYIFLEIFEGTVLFAVGDLLICLAVIVLLLPF